jgi:hypothetical protein
MAGRSTESEKAINAVARTIHEIDAHSLRFEYLKIGKQKINSARRLLWEVIEANGYELNRSYRAVRRK